jgi:hypothetical protein
MIFQWEGVALCFFFNVAYDSTDVTPLHSEANVKVRRHGVMFDDGLRSHNTHISYLSQSHLTAIRRPDQQIANIAHAIAYFGDAPDDNVKDLLLLEEAAN